MVPLFKSHYSIGKSILTLNESSQEAGSVSIFDLASTYDLSSIALVEDTLTGFLQAFHTSTSLGIKLHFGLRISLCSDCTSPPPKGGDKTCHKIIIFSKNSVGCQLLNQIYSYAFTQGSGRIDSTYLRNIWDSSCLKLAVPFYDSFIFNNLMTFSTCLMDFDFASPTFLLEDNNLPFDSMVREKVLEYCSKGNYSTEDAKSIYYAKRDDFAAYQTYKCICSRSSFGRSASLEKPNLDHCSSQEFCMESWHKKARD